MLSFHVKFVQTDRRTNKQTDSGKTICSRSFDTGRGGGGIKIMVWFKQKLKNSKMTKRFCRVQIESCCR